MRCICLMSAAMALAASDLSAQSACPGVLFKNSVSASLTPSVLGRLTLVR